MWDYKFTVKNYIYIIYKVSEDNIWEKFILNYCIFIELNDLLLQKWYNIIKNKGE